MDFRVSQPLDGRWRTGARLERDGEERRLIKYFLMLRLIAATSRVGASRCATLASVRAPVAAIAQRRWLSSGGVVEVPIPLLGAESIVEGNVLSIAKKVGDYVAKEEMVAEIETDKVTIEAKSPEAGTITAIHVAVDQTVEVGKPFFSLAVGQGQAAAASAPAAADSASAQRAAAARQH